MIANKIIQDENENPAPNLETRLCHKCGNENMASYKRIKTVTGDGWKHISVYTCPECAHEIIASSKKANSWFLGIAVLVVFLLGPVPWFFKQDTLIEAIIITIGCILTFMVPAWYFLIAAKRNSVTGARPLDERDKVVPYEIVTQLQNQTKSDKYKAVLILALILPWLAILLSTWAYVAVVFNLDPEGW